MTSSATDAHFAPAASPSGRPTARITFLHRVATATSIVKVLPGRGRWMVECSCGWSSWGHVSEAAAEDAMREHMDGVLALRVEDGKIVGPAE